MHGAGCSGTAVPAEADVGAAASRAVPRCSTSDYAMLITGVGGTGVVTIGAMLAMAAHLEGKGVGVIDMAGLAQKGGPVTSHVRIAPTPEDIKAIRVAAGGADTILACDMVVAGSAKVACRDPTPAGRRVFVNTHETYPGEFTRDADFALPTRRLMRRSQAGPGAERTRIVEATQIADRAHRRRDRHQHVHARPRLAVGGDAALARRDRAGDRAERRRRRR